MTAGLLQPIMDILKRAAIGDVKEEEPTHRVTVVSPGNGPAKNMKWREVLNMQLFHQVW